MYESLGDRIKTYENAFRHFLPIRMPVILRLDGKAFHTVTKQCDKPFDEWFMRTMDQTAIALCNELQNAKIAYVQSDEISILLIPYTELDTQPWVENNIQKMVSIAASIAGAQFSLQTPDLFGEYRAVYFDARAFVVPKEEVNNAFLWRQQDASRNSISMVAQSLYSHKELHGKNSKQKQEMIFQKSGLNWNDLPTRQKRGRCIIKASKEVEMLNKLTGCKEVTTRSEWVVDNEIPLFNLHPNYIEKFVYPNEIRIEVSKESLKFKSAPGDFDNEPEKTV